MMKQVIAVIVTYNRKELLKECILANINQSFKHDILIVDNNSTDGTREFINSYINNNVKYVNTGKNLGGAGGFNFGIKYAIKNFDYKYIWLMDDDTIPKEDALQNLYNAATQELKDNFGFLASKVLWKDNTFCNMNIPVISKNWTEDIEKLEKGILRLNSSSFVSCFIKQETIRQLGLPIKEFFIWADDVEYTTRIAKVYKSYFINSSCVIHKMSSNSSKYFLEDNDKQRIGRLFYTYRNRFYIRKKEGFVGIIKHIGMFIRDFNLALFKSKKYRFYRSWIILKGFCCRNIF